MKTEQAKQLAEQALEKLIEALEAGKSEALKAYLATMSRFHHYSFGNVMLIAFQSPTATHVAGFNTWKSLGRYVKKAERGITILAPIVVNRKNQDKEVDEKRIARTHCLDDLANTDFLRSTAAAYPRCRSI